MIRAYQDNVIIRLEPLATTTASGLHLPQTQATRNTGTREATVMAVGPGHYRTRKGGANGTERGLFVPTQVQVGERVLVDALAGQDYDMDLNVPRHNKPAHWADERGEFRIVREEEILCVVERDEAAE